MQSYDDYLKQERQWAEEVAAHDLTLAALRKQPSGEDIQQMADQIRAEHLAEKPIPAIDREYAMHKNQRKESGLAFNPLAFAIKKQHSQKG